MDILYGSVSPSGKLPYTIAKTQADYGTAIASGDDSYAEGLFIDYRHFDQSSIAPRYEFGFGLSYTSFSYANLVLSSISTTPGSSALLPGGKANLYDAIATVSVSVTNNGTVSGAEVAQLYIGFPSSVPNTPPKQLRGFKKINLAAGVANSLTFSLRRKDLSYWDTTTQSWILPAGTFNVYVGSSSRDIRLSGTLSSSGAGTSTGLGSTSTSTSVGATTSLSTTSLTSTTTPTLTTKTSSTSIASTTTSSATGAQQTLYGQCGGTGYTGPTVCASGSCKVSNAYYSKCISYFMF